MNEQRSDDDDVPGLESLLERLKHAHGFDFTGYKRSSLARRVRRRMATVGIGGFGEYGAYLESHPEEHELLFNTILINVTTFFRDPESWEVLRRQVLPRITAGARPQIRIWSAGCASGEEPYTIAMLLADALGLDEFCRRVKIYATDWDSEALVQARRAIYRPEQLDAVPSALRERYFTEHGGGMRFDGALRRAVIFGRHDLTEDPPISKLDLLSCRNTLMYFRAPAQAKTLAKMHFALADTGFLFLGRAEMLLSHTRYFTPFEIRHRLFTKHLGAGFAPVVDTSLGETEANDVPSPDRSLRAAALDAGPIAQVVFDAADRLALFNARASTLFSLGAPDVGKRLPDLELSYRPADLRSMLDRAREHRAPVVSAVSRTLHGGDAQHFEITLTPLYHGGECIATSVTFDDVTRHQILQENLQQFSDNLETAYEELQSANEELETTNEELQSSNEELETTNEELQAANEEMETINEELRSTNEELGSANEQLRAREGQLDSATGFLQAILGSLSFGVAVVDADLRVQVWNERAEELWGLRSDEVRGQVLTALDIGLPVGELEDPLRDALRDGRPRTASLSAVNRRGRRLACKVTISPLRGGASAAATLLMESITPGDAP